MNLIQNYTMYLQMNSIIFFPVIAEYLFKRLSALGLQAGPFALLQPVQPILLCNYSTFHTFILSYWSVPILYYPGRGGNGALHPKGA